MLGNSFISCLARMRRPCPRGGGLRRLALDGRGRKRAGRQRPRWAGGHCPLGLTQRPPLSRHQRSRAKTTIVCREVPCPRRKSCSFQEGAVECAHDGHGFVGRPSLAALPGLARVGTPMGTGRRGRQPGSAPQGRAPEFPGLCAGVPVASRSRERLTSRRCGEVACVVILTSTRSKPEEQERQEKYRHQRGRRQQHRLRTRHPLRSLICHLWR